MLDDLVISQVDKWINSYILTSIAGNPALSRNLTKNGLPSPESKYELLNSDVNNRIDEFVGIAINEFKAVATFASYLKWIDSNILTITIPLTTLDRKIRVHCELEGCIGVIDGDKISFHYTSYLARECRDFLLVLARQY